MENRGAGSRDTAGAPDSYFLTSQREAAFVANDSIRCDCAVTVIFQRKDPPVCIVEGPGGFTAADNIADRHMRLRRVE